MLTDWVSPWWQAACLPKLWDVCGIAVPSLSLWHMFALENIGNRFLVDGIPTMDDATSLLLFAQHNRQGGLHLLHSVGFKEWKERKTIRAIMKQDMADVFTSCASYVDTCIRSAQRWESSGGTSSSASVPYQFHIVHTLCADYGMTVEEAWDTPYAYGRALFDAKAEANGDSSIASPSAEALAAKNIADGADLYAGAN